MKRIKEACLFQTVHFALKEDIPPTIAVRAVQEEYRHYKEQLDRKRIRYQITEEKTLPDGSIQIKVRKQVNEHPIGGYFEGQV